jgi:hypothetical protein
VEAARIAVEARLRIERDGETYSGGFKAWWDSYCANSPWPASKLLTAGCWRETKKTGVVAEPAQIEAKVAELKRTDANRKRAERQNYRRSEKSEPVLISDIDPPEGMLSPAAEPQPVKDERPSAPTRFADLVSAWDNASDDERTRFLDHIGATMQPPKLFRASDGSIADPPDVLIKRTLHRLKKADEIDPQIEDKLQFAEEMLERCDIPLGVAHMKDLQQIFGKARGHRRGSIADVEKLLELAVVETATTPDAPPAREERANIAEILEEVLSGDPRKAEAMIKRAKSRHKDEVKTPLTAEQPAPVGIPGRDGVLTFTTAEPLTVAVAVKAAPPSATTIRPDGRSKGEVRRADCKLPRGCIHGGCASLGKCLEVSGEKPPGASWVGKTPPVQCNAPKGACRYAKCAEIGCCQISSVGAAA